MIRTSDYGVPQRRRRLILLASRFGPIRLIGKTHVKEVTVRDVIYDLPPIGAGEKNLNDRLHVALALSDKNIQRIRCSLPGAPGATGRKAFGCRATRRRRVIPIVRYTAG